MTSNERKENRTDLDGVEAARDASVLHLDVGRRVRELALDLGARALVACELATHLEGEPARVLHLQVVHHRLHHGHSTCWRCVADRGNNSNPISSSTSEVSASH